MSWDILLFDLDGTLFSPALYIQKFPHSCFQYISSDSGSLNAQADHFLIYFFLQLPTSLLCSHLRIKTGNTITDAWNRLSIRAAITLIRNS